jgi:hypothetical protein
MVMNTWEIDLNGTQIDINEVARIAGAFGCTIDNDADGNFHLGGTAFSALSDPAKVRQTATKLLSRMNGAVRLAHTDHIPVQLGSGVARIEDGGVRHVSVSLSSGSMRMRGSPVILRITKADGTVETDAETTKENRRLAHLAKDEELGGVLDAISGDLSWQRLRVGFERLAEIVGGGGNAFVKQGYATREEIARLKSNMEHPEHSGIDAVHGVPDGPVKGAKMTPQEALTFITRLLHSHIDNAK